MKATLGGLIKDYRMQKNLSQLDIAFSMGWKEPSQLSRIEQGKVEKPRRQMIDKLTEVMQCSPNEKHTLLLAGGYIPTEQEDKVVKKLTLPTLNNWKYPAYVLDFSWRIIDYNNTAKQFYNFTPKQLKENTNVLNILFNSSQTKVNKNWDNYLAEKLTLYKSDQKHNTKERWYINTVKQNMAKNPMFRELWNKSEYEELQIGLNNYEAIEFVLNKKTYNFHIFRNSLVYDPRFEIYLHIPANNNTLTFFN